MTVAELIKKLQEYPEETLVYTFDGEYSDLHSPDLHTKRMFLCHENNCVKLTYGYEEFSSQSYNQQQEDGSLKEVVLNYSYFDGLILNK